MQKSKHSFNKKIKKTDLEKIKEMLAKTAEDFLKDCENLKRLENKEIESNKYDRS